MSAHPKLGILFTVFMGELVNKALFTLTAPFIFHDCVKMKLNQANLCILHSNLNII